MQEQSFSWLYGNINLTKVTFDMSEKRKFESSKDQPEFHCKVNCTKTVHILLLTAELSIARDNCTMSMTP